jgi:hypothetical protein
MAMLDVSGGPFPNGKVSVITISELRCAGCDVVPTPGGGANHVTVITPNPLLPEQAKCIADKFSVITNPSK